jgi:hypothetical protein
MDGRVLGWIGYGASFWPNALSVVPAELPPAIGSGRLFLSVPFTLVVSSPALGLLFHRILSALVHDVCQ